MGNLGWSEIFFIVVFALIIFGPRKLPEIARTIGKYMAYMRRMSDEFKQTWEAEIERETLKVQLDQEATDEAVKQLTAQSSETAAQLEALSAEKDDLASDSLSDAADAQTSSHNDVLISESANSASSHNVVEDAINSGLQSSGLNSKDEHPVSIA